MISTLSVEPLPVMRSPALPEVSVKGLIVTDSSVRLSKPSTEDRAADETAWGAAVVERGMRLFPSLLNESRPDAPRGEPVRRVRRYPAESPRQLMRLAGAFA